MDIFLTFALVFLLAWPLGLYIARFMRGERTFLDFLNPVERLLPPARPAPERAGRGAGHGLARLRPRDAVFQSGGRTGRLT